jgi:hypothetical protein
MCQRNPCKVFLDRRKLRQPNNPLWNDPHPFRDDATERERAGPLLMGQHESDDRKNRPSLLKVRHCI